MMDHKDVLSLLDCVKHDDRLHILMLEVLAEHAICQEVREAYKKLLQENQDARRTK